MEAYFSILQCNGTWITDKKTKEFPFSFCVCHSPLQKRRQLEKSKIIRQAGVELCKAPQSLRDSLKQMDFSIKLGLSSMTQFSIKKSRTSEWGAECLQEVLMFFHFFVSSFFIHKSSSFFKMSDTWYFKLSSPPHPHPHILMGQSSLLKNVVFSTHMCLHNVAYIFLQWQILFHYCRGHKMKLL